MTASFHILSNSSFTYHPLFRCFIVRVTEKSLNKLLLLILTLASWQLEEVCIDTSEAKVPPPTTSNMSASPPPPVHPKPNGRKMEMDIDPLVTSCLALVQLVVATILSHGTMSRLPPIVNMDCRSQSQTPFQKTLLVFYRSKYFIMFTKLTESVVQIIWNTHT
jgi:hypothetical protein